MTITIVVVFEVFEEKAKLRVNGRKGKERKG